jgi:hypothetical protein
MNWSYANLSKLQLNQSLNCEIHCGIELLTSGSRTSGASLADN